MWWLLEGPWVNAFHVVSTWAGSQSFSALCCLVLLGLSVSNSGVFKMSPALEFALCVWGSLKGLIFGFPVQGLVPE